MLQGEAKGHINIHRQSKSRQALHFPIPTTINFLSDPLKRHTIMELITTDHAGLLSKIGRAFVQQNVNLQSAKISTIGSRAEDMFYITDQQLQPITDTDKQNLIREEILEMLDAEG
jgi:[protein-PII] uridylyltransferase